MAEPNSRPRVVYLLGAGASQASIEHVGSKRRILMGDLAQPLADSIRALVQSKKKKYETLFTLINEIVHQDANIEHVITFLDESPSVIHRQFAEDLRKVFQNVLRNELDEIKSELGEKRFSLYAALFDMYQVDKCPEELQAILTLNYDEYAEAAAQAIYETPVDLGIAYRDPHIPGGGVKVLKLHGSFDWRDVWPIRKHKTTGKSAPLWIPPGIQKSKERYPFNTLWGLAREQLDCDILRIIGCKLSSSDWDLISLLFTTRHSNAEGKGPYMVEVIDSPTHARSLGESYPYLDVRSILEIEHLGIGSQLVAEFSGGPPETFRMLSPERQVEIQEAAGTSRNWFRIWLRQMAEAFEREFGQGAVDTRKGAFSQMLQGA